MKPLVSILIPVFNGQKWFAETMRSAIGQTWERKEIVVVNDGSSDQTLAIAKQFAGESVRIVTQDNQGASAARNKALSLSQGDYIQWLDADDLLAHDKIAKQMEALERSGTKRTLLSSAWGQFKYRFSRADFKPTLLWHDLSPAEWILRKMEHNLHMQTATWLVSRELTEAAGPWDVRLLVDDDGEYFCRVLLKSDGVMFVPESKVFYRLSGSSSLSYIGQSKGKLDSHFLSMQLHIGYLRSLKDDNRVRMACRKYLQTWLSYYYPERKDIVKEMQRIGADLGGELDLPRLPWKYTWIKLIFGWSLAKRAMIILQRIRHSLARHLDKLFYWIEKQKRAGIS